MTEESSLVPDEGPLTFKLWFPRWLQSDQYTTCTFDVTAAGLDPLAGGTEASMRDFVTDLGAADPVVHRWSIERYRSPFFSNNPSAGQWRDRLPIAWAVNVEIDGAISGDTEWGPYGTYGFDETSLEEDDQYEPDRERVIVIGVLPPGTGEPDFSGLVKASSVRVELRTGVIRIDLGELDLPDELAEVTAVIDAGRENGLRTDWRTASE